MWSSYRFSLSHGLVLSLLSLTVGCPQVTVPQLSSSLSAEASRSTIASQCAQAVFTCTSSWPTAVPTVVAIEGQTVTATDDGFTITGQSDQGGFDVQLSASDSIAGNGAMSLTYRWSTGATDTDPCTLADGQAFSSEEMPLQRMDIGVHYIRLRVENDIIREIIDTDSCGVIGEDIASYHFVEIVVEVRSN